MTFIKHTGKSGGFSKDDKREHNGGCVIVMEIQSASITKTGEARHRAPADTNGHTIPESLIASG